jgi:undecaprenyl-diphosphatase
VAVPIVKSAVDRPRPADPLVDVSGWSFPSGHAASSVAYVAIAVLVARTLPRATARVALVSAAFVLAVLVGLSRVYLRVHYLSDVIAGWAFSLAIFSLCGCVGLLVVYLRNNDRSPRPPDVRPAGTASG